jgi:acetolactate synthase-1/3 small subunit
LSANFTLARHQGKDFSIMARMKTPKTRGMSQPPAEEQQPLQRFPRHVISVLVRNVPGLLAQVANLFAARGYNIESLTVAETENPRFSRMTLVVRAETKIIEALKVNLTKFVNVIRVLDYTGRDFVERELALIKVRTPEGKRHEIFQLTEVFMGKIVDIGIEDCMIELSGPEAKIDAVINLLRPFGIKEIARTGRLALARGPKMEGRRRE